MRRSSGSVRALRVVATPRADGEIADTAGTLAAVYAPTPRTLVLIRPDGDIGTISDAGDPDAVLDALRAAGVR